MLRYGKQDATTDDRDLRFGAYLDDDLTLPKVPTSWGTTGLIPAHSWGMLGNDEWGDCAIAGPAHETMLWTADGQAHKPAPFSTASVLADYSAWTGFDPNAGPPGENDTDQGSNVRDVAGHRQKTGSLDAHGHRHKIAAYVNISTSNMAHVLAAGYLLDAVGLGIQVPDSAQRQFANGQPWDVEPGAQIEGGHYVPLIAANAAFLYVVTWGRVQAMTRAFYNAYADETWGYLSPEFIANGKSPDGFNVAQLTTDLHALGH